MSNEVSLIRTQTSEAAGRLDDDKAKYIRRRVVAGVSAAVLAVSTMAAVKSGDAQPIGNSAAPRELVVYPSLTEDQLRVLPDQAHIVAKTGEGVDGLIQDANPGLLTSEIPGSSGIVHKLEDVVGSEAPNGIVQDGVQYSVAVVPNEVAESK